MNKGVYSMNKTMEMYSPSHKKRVMAEVVEGYAQNSKGGTPRLALKGLFEGKKTLPKKVNAETFEKYGFNAEQTIAAFHAESVGEHTKCPKCKQMTITDDSEGYEVCSDSDCGWFEEGLDARHDEETYGAEQVGEPLPESPLEDAPSDTPSPIEPTNENFSAEYDEMDEVVYTGDGNDEGCSECERTIGYGEYIKVDEEGSLRICSDCYTDAPYANFSADNHLQGSNCNYCGSDNIRRIKGYICMNCANEVNYHAEDSPSPSGPSEEPEPAEATGSEPSNENFSADDGRIVGSGGKRCWDCGGVIPTAGDGPYDASILCDCETFNTDTALVEEPDWIPAGDGRALGQQNFGINMSPLHAESVIVGGYMEDAQGNVLEEGKFLGFVKGEKDKDGFVPTNVSYYDIKNPIESRHNELRIIAKGVNYAENRQQNAEDVICAYCEEVIEENPTFTHGEIVYHDYCAEKLITMSDGDGLHERDIAYWGTESQESMILEACGICDKEFNSETLNADGYCGSCCATRLAEFDYRADDAYAYYMLRGKYSPDEDWEVIANFDDMKKATDAFNRFIGNTFALELVEIEDILDEEENLIDNREQIRLSHQNDEKNYDAESKGFSKNAQIALGLTALGVGLALWKSDSIMNIIDTMKKLGE